MIHTQFSLLTRHTVVDPVVSDNRPYQLCSLPLHTVAVPVVSDNGSSSFVLFVTSLQSRDYVFTLLQLNYFILSIVFLNTISTGFFSITAKKASLSFFFERNLFLQFDWFYFRYLPNIIVWFIPTIIYIIYHSIFRSSDSKLSLFDATV